MSVAVTGIGIICSLGISKSPVWERLLAGKPQMTTISTFDPCHYGLENCVVAAVPPNEFQKAVTSLRERGIPTPPKGRFRLMSLIAAAEALEDSALDLNRKSVRSSAGIVLGTMSGGAEEVERIVLAALQGKKPRVAENIGKRPTTAIQDIAKAFELRGPMFAVDAACASGAFAFTQACRLVATSATDWCVAGGVECSLVPSNLKLADSLGVLTNSYQREPARASRPFDRQRDGYVPAEGACFVVLESCERALQRGAHIYAEVSGFAEELYPYHPTKLSPEFAEGLMRRALESSGISVREPGWINAHATATQQGDAAEAQAIDQLANGTAVRCSAPKSVTGHLLGASGAAEIAFSALSLDSQLIPPTINLEELDPRCPINCITEVTAASVEYVLSNSFGFGGAGCSVLLKKCQS